MKIYIHQLGCDKNRVDGEKLSAKLANNGYEVSSTPENCDLVIVNTCGFITAAKEESIDTILSYSGKHKLVVTGCLAKRYEKELAKELKEADAIFGLSDSEETINGIIKKYPIKKNGHRKNLSCNSKQGVRRLGESRHYAPLKISEGCSNNCSYCAIPLIRGKYKQRDSKEIIKEAIELRRQGVKELIIVAQDTTAYGERKGLPQLLEKIAGLKNPFPWIRLMYCHPLGITDDLISAIANLPILPYIDMPIQHVSDPILERMNRHYTRLRLESIIKKMRDKIPDITIRTTVISGFPGETDKQHEELLDFISTVEFDRMGAFAYSHEEGTRAAAIKKRVPQKIIDARIEELLYTQNDIIYKKNCKKIGSTFECIVDSTTDGTTISRTRCDAPEVDCAVISNNAKNKEGDFVTLKIKNAIGVDLYS